MKKISQILFLLLLMPKLLLAVDQEDFRPPAVEMLPGGILFPKFTSANVINPATLAMQWGISGHLIYSPPFTPDNPHTTSISAAWAHQEKFGFGASYTRHIFSEAEVHGMAFGGGYHFEDLALGLSIREPNFFQGFSPEFDLGTVLDLRIPVELAFTAYDLFNTTDFVMGMGMGRGRLWHFETNLLVPLYSSTASSFASYRWNISISSIFDKVGLSLSTSYRKWANPTDESAWATTFGALVWFTENFAVNAQYGTPNSYAFGITFAWSPTLLEKIAIKNKRYF